MAAAKNSPPLLLGRTMTLLKVILLGWTPLVALLAPHSIILLSFVPLGFLLLVHIIQRPLPELSPTSRGRSFLQVHLKTLYAPLPLPEMKRPLLPWEMAVNSLFPSPQSSLPTFMLPLAALMGKEPPSYAPLLLKALTTLFPSLFMSIRPPLPGLTMTCLLPFSFTLPLRNPIRLDILAILNALLQLWDITIIDSLPLKQLTV